MKDLVFGSSVCAILSKLEKKHTVLAQFVMMNTIYQRFSVSEVRLDMSANPAPMSLAPSKPI